MVHTDSVELSHPLASLLPSAEAGALAVLIGTEAPLTGRRIAELAGETTHASTLRALRRLSDQGLVHVEAAGRAHLYRLNRDHVLAAPLIEMASATTRLRHQLADRVSTWQVPALHVSLYGSVARGEATSSSDVDVLVVRPESLDPAHVGIWEDQLAALEIEVYSWTGNHLSWLDTTIKDLRRAAAAGEPIFQSWRDDAILLTGRPLNTLLRTPQQPGSA